MDIFDCSCQSMQRVRVSTRYMHATLVRTHQSFIEKLNDRTVTSEARSGGGGGGGESERWGMGSEVTEADQVALQIIYNYLYNYRSILLTAVCHNRGGWNNDKTETNSTLITHWRTVSGHFGGKKKNMFFLTVKHLSWNYSFIHSSNKLLDFGLMKAC